MEEQFARERALIGPERLARLRASHVLVCGLGGVGGHAAEALARGGVGALTLVDHDVVEPANLNRQLAALHSTLGQPKADVLASRLRDIVPDCRVRPLRLFYGEETRDEVFACRPDYILDAVDCVTAKLDLAETALRLGIPLVSCMGTGNRLDPLRFRITDISESSVCPLARVMRRELKKRGIARLEALWSDEEPTRAEGAGAGRLPPASISYVPAAAGLLLAGHVLRKLMGGL